MRVLVMILSVLCFLTPSALLAQELAGGDKYAAQYDLKMPERYLGWWNVSSGNPAKGSGYEINANGKILSQVRNGKEIFTNEKCDYEVIHVAENQDVYLMQRCDLYLSKNRWSHFYEYMKLEQRDDYVRLKRMGCMSEARDWMGVSPKEHWKRIRKGCGDLTIEHPGDEESISR